MATFSKLLYYSCYEIGHTWDADCSVGIFDSLISTLLGSMKIYAVVYLLTALLKWKKITKLMAIDMFQNYMRSVCFLTVNGGAFVASVCFLSKLFGHTNFLSAVYLPSFIASLLAINVERPNRRNMLALYVTNVASVCLWNVAVGRKYITPVRNGEVIIFMLGIAILGYYRSREQSPLVKSLFQFLIGKKSNKKNLDDSKKSEILFSSNSNRSIGLGRNFLLLCPEYLQSFSNGFARGYGARVAIKLISSVSKVFRNPFMITNILLEREAFNAGLFIATFSCTFKFVSWLSSKNRKKPSSSDDCLAGFIAGMSMLWFPSPTISLYIFWKGIEIIYMKLSEDGYLPRVPYGIEMLYCFCTAYLFQVAIFEPHHMKSSYWRFLYNLTEGRIAEYNRKVLDVYGLDSGLIQNWPTYREVDRLSHKFRKHFSHEFKS